MTEFNVLNRAFSIIRNGSKLLVVGFGCSGIGVALTNTLVWAREQLDPTFHNENPPQVRKALAALLTLF